MTKASKLAIVFALTASFFAAPTMACVECIEKCWGWWAGCLEFCGIVSAGWDRCRMVGEYCTIQPAIGCTWGEEY